MKTRLLNIILITLLSSIGFTAKASHIYGADLYYTHVSGLTYNVTLVVYGACGWTSQGSSFPTFPTSSADINIFNNTTLYTQIVLPLQNPKTGVEVTPVCPSQINNTICSSPTNTIPGVKKFVYTGNVTLNTTSTNWRFRFTGDLNSSTAGRTNSITNINFPIGGSIMNLEATLNNTNGANSSPTFTTIPTPYFCINKPASYNPGSVDPNGDSLSYSLVPALTRTGVVTYKTGYSATSPLAASTGTFSFNNKNGQLGFTPNLVQQSTVANQINEYKNGVLVGTSMREMTFVVLSNCNNNPPGGKINNNSAGTVDTSKTEIKVCKSTGLFTFQINPTDPDTDKINMVASGLPAGASLSISNNNTTAPTSIFSWNVTNMTPGSYTFFITYTDEGCPLSSKQTLAYTIIVLPNPDVSFSIDSLATCVKKAVITMTPSVTPSPWRLQVLQGTTQVHNFTGVTGAQKDSLSPGTYTIRVTNADTCFKDTIITIPPPPPPGISLAITDPVCNNDTNGQVVVTGTGGKPTYTFAMNGNNFAPGNTFNNLGGGFYTFKVRDENFCVKDTLVQVINPLPLTANVIFDQPPCNYYNSGVITVNAVNGTAPYRYALDTGPYSSNNKYSGLFSGNYTIHIRDTNNCKLDSVVTLPDSIKVHANATLTNILCNSDSTGAISLSAFGGTAPYRYQITGGTLSSVNTFNNLPATTHNFHIEDTNKCYLDTAITLTEPPLITSTSAVTDVLCFGDTTGAINISAAGGVNPYTYARGTGTYTSSGSFNPLTAGTYTIHIKDDNGCIRDTSITITEPTKLEFDALNINNPLCYNTATGNVTVDGKGGTTPYTFAIGTGAFGVNNTFNALSDGNYTFKIKDDHGCEIDTPITLQEPPRIVPSVSLKQATCSNIDDGSAMISATGGTPGYTYAIGTGPFSANNTFSPLGANTYTLRVRDDNSCTQDTVVTVTDSIVITANYNITDVLCFDSSNGALEVTPAGGVNPYTFALNTGSYGTNNKFGQLAIGTYTIHTKDDIGCKIDTTVTLTQPTPLTLSATVKDASCSGYLDGLITLNAGGGTTPYEYRIDTGNFSQINVFNSIKAKTYTFYLRDGNGCPKDTVLTINEPPAPKYTMSTTDVLCAGDSTGTVSINGSGGTPPYTYSADGKPFGSTPILAGLDSGIHKITMKDGNGCLKDTLVTISEPPPLSIDSLAITDPTCEGFTDGEVSVLASGGTSPYQYSVGSGFSSNNTLTGLNAGNKLISIKDANNCTLDSALLLEGLPPIVSEPDVTDITCYGLEDGIVTINASGGVPPFVYARSTSSSGIENTFTGLAKGQHTFKITDDAGCEKEVNIDINEPAALEVSTTATPNDCEGYDDGGRISATAIGGTGNYDYIWSTQPIQYGSTASGLGNGKYRVVVTDENNCVDSIITEVPYDNCCKIFIPDAFTPNGDGVNDDMRIFLKGDFELEVFSIYNRFGELVFTTGNIEEGWNGMHNGTLQKIDTYNYFVKGTCGNDKPEQVMYKGTLHLIR